MQRYARTDDNNVVVETIDLDDAEDIGDRFPADLGFVACPTEVDQRWTRAGDAWSAPIETVEERKARMRAEVTMKRNTLFYEGYTATLPGGGTALLQTRTADRTNWLTAQALYAAAIAAGQGDAPGATIRDDDDVNHAMTFAEAHAILLAMAGHGAAILSTAWALKDAIEAAPDEAALDAIDIAAAFGGA